MRLIILYYSITMHGPLNVKKVELIACFLLKVLLTSHKYLQCCPIVNSKTSGILCHVDWQLVTNVLEKFAASNFLECPQHGGRRLL